jgi:hypothetical protein
MRRLTNKPSKFVFSLAVLFLFISSAVSAAPLTIGESLPELTLPDQHGDRHTLGNCKMVLFAPDKGAGEMAHKVLNQSDTAGMTARGIVFISDVSGMPAFVRRMFALPAMRDYPYAVLLGYEKEDTAIFPRQKGRVTVLHIKAGRISRIEYAASSQGLAGIIGSRSTVFGSIVFPCFHSLPSPFILHKE